MLFPEKSQVLNREQLCCNISSLIIIFARQVKPTWVTAGRWQGELKTEEPTLLHREDPTDPFHRELYRHPLRPEPSLPVLLLVLPYTTLPSLAGRDVAGRILAVLHLLPPNPLLGSRYIHSTWSWHRGASRRPVVAVVGRGLLNSANHRDSSWQPGQ